MTKKQHVIIFIILAVVAAGAVAVVLGTQKPDIFTEVIEVISDEKDARGKQSAEDELYKLGKDKQATTTPEVIASEIDTSDWLTYHNEEFGFEFKYPGDLETTENVIEGMTGQSFILNLTSHNNENLEIQIGANSMDFSSAGRGGSFLDSQGYSKNDGKYYFIFLGSKIEIDVIKTIKNSWLGDVIIIDNSQWINLDSPGPWPTGPGPKIGKDNIGAIINLNKSKYRGLAIVKYNPSNTVIDQMFFEILKTFH